MTFETTIDLDRLRQITPWKLPAAYHLSESSGSACFLDPPGYPSYYVWSVYTRQGDTPRKGPGQVLIFEGRNYPIDHDDGFNGHDLEAKQRLLRELWKPLPWEHPRTQLWIRYLHLYFRHCYCDDAQVLEKDRLLIYPVPSYKLRHFQDDPRWKDEYRQAGLEEVAASNALLEHTAAAIATPENHQATRLLRKFYPAAEPQLELIAHPPEGPIGAWWETLDEQPSEADCAKSQRWGHKHPFGGTWCQWCGRTYKQQDPAVPERTAGS